MIIGYARVSTEEQNLDRQLDQLRAMGAEKIFSEKITGTKKDRPEFQRMIEQLRAGDTVIVSELTRLSRSTKDLIAVVEELGKKGIDIKSLKESWMDTTTATGKLMFTIMAGFSQFERDLISERTKDGLKSARARGRIGGRKKKDQKAIDKALKLYDSQEYTLIEITDMTGVSKATFTEGLMKERKIQNDYIPNVI